MGHLPYRLLGIHAERPQHALDGLACERASERVCMAKQIGGSVHPSVPGSDSFFVVGGPQGVRPPAVRTTVAEKHKNKNEREKRNNKQAKISSVTESAKLTLTAASAGMGG